MVGTSFFPTYPAGKPRGRNTHPPAFVYPVWDVPLPPPVIQSVLTYYGPARPLTHLGVFGEYTSVISETGKDVVYKHFVPPTYREIHHPAATEGLMEETRREFPLYIQRAAKAA